MITFFTIFFILILMNVVLLTFSALNASQKVARLSKRVTEHAATQIYPLELSDSKYKKAV
jgi:hypothetical protein